MSTRGKQKMAQTFGRQNLLKLIEIRKRLSRGQPRIVDASRVFIKEGQLTKVHKRGKTCKRHAFLFSDLLLLCKPKPFSHTKLVCTAAVFLENATLEVLLGAQDTSDATLFSVVSGDVKMLLCAEDPGRAHDWVDAIADAILHPKPQYRSMP